MRLSSLTVVVLHDDDSGKGHALATLALEAADGSRAVTRSKVLSQTELDEITTWVALLELDR
jgi:hypothetical protein